MKNISLIYFYFNVYLLPIHPTMSLFLVFVLNMLNDYMLSELHFYHYELKLLQ